MKTSPYVIFLCVLALAASQFACAFAARLIGQPEMETPSPAPQAVANQAATLAPQPPAAADACNPTSPPLTASGLISQTTLAKGVEEVSMAAVNPTSTFNTTDMFHAVVTIHNAPGNTRFSAAWYALNVGAAASCNTLIDENEVVTDGSRNVDFNLTPESFWPPGTYRVAISVNGQLESVQDFRVE